MSFGGYCLFVTFLLTVLAKAALCLWFRPLIGDAASPSNRDAASPIGDAPKPLQAAGRETLLPKPR